MTLDFASYGRVHAKAKVNQVKVHTPSQLQDFNEALPRLTQFGTNWSLKIQESLKHLALSLHSNQALQASALVGRTVLLNNNYVYLGAMGDVAFLVDVMPELDSIRVCVYGENKELLNTIVVDKPEQGSTRLIWDGLGENRQRLAAGKYKIEASGFVAGEEIVLNTQIFANVDSVQPGPNGEGLRLKLAGMGAVVLSKVRQVSEN